MSVDLDNVALDWQPVNIKKNVDGSDQELEEESRIGTYQFELSQRASGNTPVCLDANDWFPTGRDPNPVIMYQCHKERLKFRNNQKWELWLKDQVDGERYYVLRSQSKYFKGKVLAVRDKRLVLEDESEVFDENQRWLIRWAPKTNSKALTRPRMIVWAGMGGEFTLQADEVRLRDYSNAKATTPFLLQGFNNSPNQTWTLTLAKNVNEPD
jgi:hypothetical protein